MAIRRRTTPELLGDIRLHMEKGEVAGSIERIRRLSRRDDVDLLRGLVDILASHIENPPRRKRGRPRKSSPDAQTSSDGLYLDLDATPTLTQRERRHAVLAGMKKSEIVEAVSELAGRMTLVGAIAEVARRERMSEAAVRKAYYE